MKYRGVRQMHMDAYGADVPDPSEVLNHTFMHMEGQASVGS